MNESENFPLKKKKGIQERGLKEERYIEREKMKIKFLLCKRKRKKITKIICYKLIHGCIVTTSQLCSSNHKKKDDGDCTVFGNKCDQNRFIDRDP